MGWTDDFSDTQIKLIGAAEVLAALALILPPLVGILPAFAVVAAAGLAALMIGASWTHVRRDELPMVLLNVCLIALACFVVWGRIGPEPF